MWRMRLMLALIAMLLLSGLILLPASPAHASADAMSSSYRFCYANGALMRIRDNGAEHSWIQRVYLPNSQLSKIQKAYWQNFDITSWSLVIVAGSNNEYVDYWVSSFWANFYRVRNGTPTRILYIC